MSSHLILKLPEYWTTNESETLFNSLGFVGWELLHIRNLHAYFMKHVNVPLRYKVVKNNDYINNLETTFNTLGQDNWILVLIHNEYSVFKKVAIA